MPVKAIRFDHNGQNVQADVVYNFNELSNAVMVVPSNAEELNENILLVRDKSRWKSSSTLRKKFPSTFNNIITKVDEELRSEISADHILMLGNFLS
jgi:hypothetical protein